MYNVKKSPVRVLHIANMNRGSGVASLIMNYYTHIDKSKVQFDFVVSRLSDQNYIADIKKMGGRVYILPHDRKIVRYYQQLKMITSQYQIIHAHESLVSLIALSISKRQQVGKRIAHSHNPSMTTWWKNLVVHFCRPLFQKFTTDLCACSNDSGNFLFGKKANFTILPNAIDIQKFKFNPVIREQLRKSLNIEGRYVIGHIGRFDKQKNHTFIVNMFSELIKQSPDAVLLLIGEGKEQQKIKKIVEQLKLLDSVHFLGVRSDIAELLQAIDIFILPSIFEGFGIVAIEAQAACLPTLVSESVPDEVLLTENSKKISVKDGYKLWVDYIIRYKNFERSGKAVGIRNSKYDISVQVNFLTEFYCSINL